MTLSPNIIKSGIAALAIGTSAIASQLPGLTFFTQYAPPAFAPVVLMTGGMTLAVFVWTFSTKRLGNSSAQVGVAVLLASLLFAVVYIALLNWTTVAVPEGAGITDRIQIGFGLSPSSLTSEGARLAKKYPQATPEYLLLAVGFNRGGAETLWTTRSIYAAWGLLCLLYFLAYLSWAFGLACVALKLTAGAKRK